MKQKTKKAAIVLYIAFILYTLLLKIIDVQPLGSMGTKIGFATLNVAVRDAIGYHEVLDKLINLFALVCYLVIAVLALIGLVQLIRRKSLVKVDLDILAYGGLLVTLLLIYLIFETVIVNYRPVTVDGMIEASYPSSHTILLVTVFLCAVPEAERRIHLKPLKNAVKAILIALAVLSLVFRFLSGVHWLTDIVGAIILSLALTNTYLAVTAE